MNVLIILSSHAPEIKWNALRLANLMLNEEDEVSLFLNGPAASLYDGDSKQFPLKEQGKLFALSGGALLA